MRDLGSLIIVHLVEPMAVGKMFPRHRANWPLHVTLVPWFYIADERRHKMLEALQTYLSTEQPFSVHVGEEKKFGPDKNVPVNLIDEQEPVRRLHNALVKVAGDYGAQFHKGASAHSGAEQTYVAHITHHQAADGLHRRFPGDEEAFDSITVARLLGDHGSQMCEIIRAITFGGKGNEATA